MVIKRIIKYVINAVGYDIAKLSNKDSFPPNRYDQDSLRTDHNHDFMNDPNFIAAYQRGTQACNEDYKFHWRVHVALWVASQARNIDGDFVECGVNRGFLSSAIMNYVNWNSLNKKFFLFDTFSGIDEKYLNEVEKEQGRLEFSKKRYAECFETAKVNFSEFKSVHLIRGTIPDTLLLPDISQVCFLSIDMNSAVPEIAAATYFWDKMVKGGWALLDDYAYVGYNEQKKAFDNFARSKGIEILSLPTGQGLYRKP